MMGRPDALARMKSDPCAFPNEWWHHQHEQNELHVPPESLSYGRLDQVRGLSIPTLVLHGAEDLIPMKSSRERSSLKPST